VNAIGASIEEGENSKIPTQTISLVDNYEASKFKPPSSTKNAQSKAFFS
jgi:hypothetical protein